MSILPSGNSGLKSITNKVSIPSTSTVTSTATSALTKQLGSIGVSPSQISKLTSSSGASSLLNASVASIAAKFPSTDNLFKNLTSNVVSKLASTKPEALLGTTEASKNFDDLTTSLNGNTSSADGGAVTYVTNTSAVSVQPHEVVPQNDTAKLLDLPSDKLAKLANFTGVESISTDKELANAESLAMDSFKSIQGQALGNAENLLTDVRGEVGGSVGNITGSSIFEISEVTQVDEYNLPSTFDEVNLQTVSAEDYLNDGDKYMLNLEEPDLVSAYTRNVAGLSQKGLPFDDIPEKSLELFNLNNDYPNITDSTGQRIPGVSNSRASADEATGMYSLASLLCPNVNSRDMHGYGNNKNLFDYLVSKCADLGLSDLLMSLLGCPQYTDNRTKSVLSSRVPSMSRRGDVSGLHSMSSRFGSDSLTGNSTSSYGDTLPWNDRDTLLTTSANMDYDDEDNVSLFDDLSSKGSTRFGDYCYDDVSPDPNTIDANTVAVMSNKSTYFADRELGSTRTETALGVLSFYS